MTQWNSRETMQNDAKCSMLEVLKWYYWCEIWSAIFTPHWGNICRPWRAHHLSSIFLIRMLLVCPIVCQMGFDFMLLSMQYIHAIQLHNLWLHTFHTNGFSPHRVVASGSKVWGGFRSLMQTYSSCTCTNLVFPVPASIVVVSSISLIPQNGSAGQVVQGI